MVDVGTLGGGLGGVIERRHPWTRALRGCMQTNRYIEVLSRSPEWFIQMMR
jgi:hypothetical protein